MLKKSDKVTSGHNFCFEIKKFRVCDNETHNYLELITEKLIWNLVYSLAHYTNALGVKVLNEIQFLGIWFYYIK